MSRAQKQQIKVGLGAPLLRSRPFGKAYDDLLLKNCFHNYAYDVQSEGPRGWYAYQLVRRSKHGKRLIKQFKKRFARMHEAESHATNQAFAVALELYRAGKMEKGPIIKKYRELNAVPNAYDPGWGTVIHLGRRGLYAYMEVTGKQLKGEKVTAHSPEGFRKKAVRKALKKWGGKLPSTDREKNKHVRRYRRRVLDRKLAAPERPTIERPQTLPELLDWIEAGRPGGRLIELYGRLTVEELRQLAELEHREPDVAKKSRYLRVFEYRDYPGDLLSLLDRLDVADHRLLRVVANVLGRNASHTIRRTVRSRLKQRKGVADSIRMLAASYTESDDALIYRTIRDVTDQGVLHSIGYAVQAVLDKHPGERMHRTLGYLYANERCGVCRRVFLQHLRTAGYLSKRRKREMRYDSYAPTRRMTSDV